MTIQIIIKFVEQLIGKENISLYHLKKCRHPGQTFKSRLLKIIQSFNPYIIWLPQYPLRSH
jgi:hypothetical protein